jgi:hypothetical protein
MVSIDDESAVCRVYPAVRGYGARPEIDGLLTVSSSASWMRSSLIGEESAEGHGPDARDHSAESARRKPAMALPRMYRRRP